MPGPTGLLAFQARFPDRFFDVGIAEQHEAASAAGMAMAGLRPVVAVYSTFWSRAFDQANLDVGLHGCPVVFVLDRAGITGDDGPSHHGILDMALALSIPGMTVFAPSSAEEVEVMLRTALELPGPSTIRVPKTAPRHVDPDDVGSGIGAAPVAVRRRDGVPPRGGQDGRALPERSGRAGPRGDRRHRVGRAGGRAARRRHAGRRRAPPPGRHGGGRRPPRWRGAFLLDAMATKWSRPAWPRPPPGCSGCPASSWPRARPDDILAALGLDGSGIAESVRRSASASRSSPAPTDRVPAAPAVVMGRGGAGGRSLAPFWRTKSFTA